MLSLKANALKFQLNLSLTSRINPFLTKEKVILARAVNCRGKYS